jgi:hypothetical protein
MQKKRRKNRRRLQERIKSKWRCLSDIREDSRREWDELEGSEEAQAIAEEIAVCESKEA